MAKFPIYRPQPNAPTSLPGRTGQSASSVDTRTGQTGLWRQAQQTGQTAFNIEADKFLKQGQTELADLMLSAKDRADRLMTELDAETDETKYADSLQKFIQSERRVKPKNGFAAKHYPRAISNLEASWQAEVRDKRAKRIDEKADYVRSTETAKAIQAGTDEAWAALESRFTTYVGTGTMSKEEADARLTIARPKWQRSAYNNNRNVVRSTAYNTAITTGNLQSGLDIIESSNLARRHKTTMKSELKRSVDKTKQSAEMDIWQRLDDNTLTDQDIQNLEWPEEGKTLEETKKSLELRRDVRNDPTVETDPTSWIASFDTVLDRWNRINNPEEARSSLSKIRYDDVGLSEEDYNTFLELANKNYPRHLMPSINTVYEDIKRRTGTFGTKNDKWAAEKTAALMSWMDSELADGRKPDLKAMYNQSRMLDVTSAPRRLTEDIVGKLLEETGGNVDKARDLAKQRNYVTPEEIEEGQRKFKDKLDKGLISPTF